MKKLVNLGLIVMLAVAALSVILWLVSGNELQNVDFMLYVAYVYLGIAILAAVVLTAMNLGKGRSNSKLGLWVFGGLALLAVIFYFTISSSAPVTGADGTVYDNVFTLKISDMMLYLAYAALAVTVVVLIGGEVRKAFK